MSPGAWKIFAALAVAAWLPSSPVAAQATLLKLVLCTKIKDDTARLKCFDEAFEDVNNVTDRSSGTNVPPTWHIKKEKSELDDSPSIIATLPATSGTSILIARCIENRTNLIVAGDYIVSSRKRTVRVVVRVNDASSIEELWLPATNGRGVFSPTAISTMRLLPDNAKLFTRVLDFQDVQHDASFQIGNFSDVRDQIAAACNWTSRK